MTEPVVSVSDAIVLLLAHFPRKNDAAFLAAVEDEATRDAVRSIVDETQRIPIEWGDKTLTDIGREVREDVHRRHPELSDAAVDRLGSYFTYLVK